MKINRSGATGIGIFITAIIVLIIGFLFTTCATSMMKYNEIKDYDYIVVNGEEYSTKDIVNVSKDLINDESTYVIYMKDGSKIYVKNYTLKNK